MESLKTGAWRISSRVFSLLESLAGLDADDGVFGVGGVDGDDFGGADGGLADVGVVDDELFALLHAAEVEEGLGLEMPSQVVSPSRTRSSKEYVSGSDLSR